MAALISFDVEMQCLIAEIEYAVPDDLAKQLALVSLRSTADAANGITAQLGEVLTLIGEWSRLLDASPIEPSLTD